MASSVLARLLKGDEDVASPFAVRTETRKTKPASLATPRRVVADVRRQGLCHVLIQSCHRRGLTPEVSGCVFGDASPPTCIPRPPSPQRGARRQPGVERSGTLGHPTP